mmetsp:Transcript_28538/g.31705  ORF Transcript_28538/g.31705 Transcript_28538/m.31705 type:complete len:232 (+) Transcript_28538:88-783(+)
MSSQRLKSVPPSHIKPTAKHEASAIFLHGLGDSAEGWLSAMQILAHRTPSIHYIIPNAPHRPVTINGGMSMPAWYDIKDLSNREGEDFDGLDETKETIYDLIQAELDAGIPSDKIIVGGFSQGGASALYAGYQYDKPLAGIASLSAYLPKINSFHKLINSANANTPLFWGHGDCDPMVRIDWGKQSFKTLQNNGVKGEFNTYQGMQHSACEQELDDLLRFMQKCLPEKAKL